MTKKRRSPPSAEFEVDLIPVLSCMFLLIPALLLAMEAANWASIPVSPPRAVAQRNTSDDPPVERLRFAVQVRSDGFVASVGSSDAAATAEQTVPMASSSADDYDYDALSELAALVKREHPSADEVSVSAEGDVSLQTLVRTMDALRGDACHLDAGGPEGECLFWRVEIEA